MFAAHTRLVVDAGCQGDVMDFVSDELSADLDALARKHKVQLVGAVCSGAKDQPYRGFHADGKGVRPPNAETVRDFIAMAMWGSALLTRLAVDATVYAVTAEPRQDGDEEWW